MLVRRDESGVIIHASYRSVRWKISYTGSSSAQRARRRYSLVMMTFFPASADLCLTVWLQVITVSAAYEYVTSRKQIKTRLAPKLILLLPASTDQQFSSNPGRDGLHRMERGRLSWGGYVMYTTL